MSFNKHFASGATRPKRKARAKLAAGREQRTTHPRCEVRAKPAAKPGLPRVERLHFIGIGGMGMSGIAEVLHNLGYRVRGSDIAENANTRRLRAMGIPIAIGHAPHNLENAQVAVASSAIPNNNSEIREAQRRLIPVIPRARMLAELMGMKSSIAIAGSHGKTTTTSMIGTVLDAAGLDPTIINGGILNAYDTNGRLGSGDWIIAEADESDGALARMQATIAVLTNMDAEHLDHYGNFPALRSAFREFIQNIPFYGIAILCIDDPEVRDMAHTLRDRRIITYGLSPEADVQGCLAPSGSGGGDGRPIHEILVRDEDGSSPQAHLAPSARREQSSPPGASKARRRTKRIGILKPPMAGTHALQNALAAIATGKALHIPDHTILNALEQFAGVQRRFTHTGSANGIRIYDDYAHHPTEIKATLAAAKTILPQAQGASKARRRAPAKLAAGRQQSSPPGASKARRRRHRTGKLIAIAQPHRYTRLRDLRHEFATCFDEADILILAPIHPAGETPIHGISHHALLADIQKHGHPNAMAIDQPAEIPGIIAQHAQPGDMVVIMGAGTCTQWANALPQQLATSATREDEEGET